MYGMPFGAPSQTVPKSGCTRFVAPPQLLISVVELGSTGWVAMSVFHGLSAGKTVRVPVEPPPPVPPPPPPPFLASAVTSGPRVESPAQAMPNARRPPIAAIAASRRIGALHSKGGALGPPTITAARGGALGSA